MAQENRLSRRTALKLLTLPWLAGCLPSRIDGTQRFLVVGAGIVGASIAYHLAKAGASVTVIDKSGPASHASRGTFAWINATYTKQPRYYHQLSQDSVAYWRTLARELSIPVRWGGSLEWFDDQDEQTKLRGLIEEQAKWGEPARMLNGQEFGTLEPEVNFAGAQQVALSAHDGHVDSVLATEVLLEQARVLGASTKMPCELRALKFNEERVKASTSCGDLAVDRVVLATGAAPDAPSQFADANIPQRTRPGIIVITKPAPLVLNHIIVAPGVHVYQRQDGRFVLGEQSGPPDTETHEARLRLRPKRFPSEILSNQHAQRIFAIAETYIPAITEAEVEEVRIGWRPLPLDGHPVLGPSLQRPNVYLAIMHSGVTLAPIVGKLVAQELLQGPVEQLDQFRPNRDFQNIKRY
ncbi:MAG: FAD-dependent oxidoreductase [Pseudomonadota bacterium]